MFTRINVTTFAAIACGLLIPITLASPVTAEIRWQSIEGVKIPIPPKSHPRLYLRAEHVAALSKRLDDPALADVVREWKRQADRNEMYRLEWRAVQYLINPDKQAGRQLIENTLDFLKRSELPDRNDACRVTGRIMVTGAIVYDWLYPLLSESEKQGFIHELVRLAKTLESGYPPTRQGSVTGHSSEAMIMRDMISAGIAIYDEYPEMYELGAGRFFAEHLPARNWLYNGHAYHQGDSYGVYRFSWDTFPLWIFDRLGAGNVYNPEQRQVPYLWIYKARPDQQRLRAGDTYLHSQARGKPWAVGAGFMLTASYYDDGRLMSQYLANGGNRTTELIFEVLWRDLDLKPEPTDDLPLTRYFDAPFGWMVARTGWDEKSVIAEMKINEVNFTNHQHLDAGAFQIYHQGALAIDSGVYSGSSGQYGSPHCRNYYWRTIAHNSLLIHDPQEDFGAREGYGNDGGQRLPNRRREPRNLDVLLDPANGYRTGKVLAHDAGPDQQTPTFSLLQGDITAAYSDKVERAVRSFVFLNLQDPKTPAALIVFDRIVSADPNHKKYWLLHSMEEPQIHGDQVVVDRSEFGQQGRLVLDTLLPKPADCETNKVGGPGREYWVFGENFPNDQSPERMERSSMELGNWRIEVSPQQPAQENLLLNVMQITNRSNSEHLPVELLETDTHAGLCMSGRKYNWIVLFARDAKRQEAQLALNLPGDGECRILITDMEAGRWQASTPDKTKIDVTVNESSGSIWLQGRAGEWRLQKAPAP